LSDGYFSGSDRAVTNALTGLCMVEGGPTLGYLFELRLQTFQQERVVQDESGNRDSWPEVFIQGKDKRVLPDRDDDAIDLLLPDQDPNGRVLPREDILAYGE